MFATTRSNGGIVTRSGETNDTSTAFAAALAALAARVRPGGRLALSGILDSQADAVVIAYSQWFTLAATRASEGWTLVSFVRNAG